MAMLLAATAAYLFTRGERGDHLSGLFLLVISLAWMKMRTPRES